jgi:thymidylate kinase
MNNSEAISVHFEGMDLAGKSLATKKFVEATGIPWEIRRNSISKDNPLFLLADSLIKSKDERYSAETLGNLYVAALMADIDAYKKPEQNTIQDSTIILRSMAYHTVNGTPRIAEVMRDLLPRHPKFDSSFVFTASIEARKKRLEKRMNEEPDQVTSGDLLIIRKPEKFLKMEAVLIDIATQSFHSAVIDTSTITPEEVVEKIIKGVYNNQEVEGKMWSF